MNRDKCCTKGDFMNREQLRYFSVAYRTHNFAAAARAIPMSAQGFVKSIRAL
jgi:DNA-binding transcriptional LysR family regulator